MCTALGLIPSTTKKFMDDLGNNCFNIGGKNKSLIMVYLKDNRGQELDVVVYKTTTRSFIELGEKMGTNEYL
jgi:hypothetical protein